MKIIKIQAERDSWAGVTYLVDTDTGEQYRRSPPDPSMGGSGFWQKIDYGSFEKELSDYLTVNPPLTHIKEV